ncbi:histone-lysine N-methyltransferase, H3 lysine-9 specific SUVH3-like [Magnolia sinica]|uniref:histone-lysine N-methyltransferase, H3 lysine-9 specific SUVH3-like n=1 Tax=Magnolia sinica TaxID=86752 RepID=UPI0026596BF3|nr:histone-lysine N-methyltransferase, H3 lysine-9 specific SUVH3-like [Magnolia sinica]
MDGCSSSRPDKRTRSKFLNVIPLDGFTPMLASPPGYPPHIPSSSYHPIMPLEQRPSDPIPQTKYGAALLRDTIRYEDPTLIPPSFHVPPPMSVGPTDSDQTLFPPFMWGRVSGDVGPSKVSNLKRSASTRSEPSRSGPNGYQRPSMALIETGGSETESDDHNPSKKVNGEDDISSSLLIDNDRGLIEKTMITFDGLRRRLLQVNIATTRPDLVAGAIMTSKGLDVNMRKISGPTKGIKIGDIFFFRYEISLIGLHSTVMGVLDYMTLKFGNEEDIVAVSLVSGPQEDDLDDPDVMVYVEHKAVSDHSVQSGNLALEKSIHRKNEIRVIRCMKNQTTPTGRIYVYDGLYNIQETWIERSKGRAIFKYKMIRLPGQPNGIVIWKSIQRWKVNPMSRPGMIQTDLSGGIENLPVYLVNNVDDEKGPTPFKYSHRVNYLSPINSMRSRVRCNCKGTCVSGNPNCHCVRLNGGYLPYGPAGVLVSRKPFIYECGAECLCSSNCRNRVTQKGVRFRLEVFKTKNRGWAVRSWDPIRAGSFICQYTGEAIEQMINVDDDDDEDGYIFEPAPPKTDPSEWNYDPALLGEKWPTETPIMPSEPFKIVISAKNMGNVARFMNHSCTPNVFWQPVVYNHLDDCYPHIMFFAIKHIPPLTELTYDYGLSGAQSSQDEVGRMIRHRRTQKCLCGSSQCRGFFR